MKNKNIIKKILFEGSHSISAILPRPLNPIESENNFVYKIPLILNKNYFLKNESNNIVDSFKIIFYKKSSFSNDFQSNFYSNTIDFKKFDNSSEVTNNIIISEKLKNITKGFYQDGTVSNKHYTVNFRNENIVDKNLYIYNITLTNAVSKEIKDENYSCMRIFSIKNNNVIDDTDFIFFENDTFLKKVYQTKKIYDLQYFINQVYLEGFSESLGISLHSSSSLDFEAIRLHKSTQFDTSILNGNVSINIDFQNTNPITSTSYQMSMSSFGISNIIRVNNSSFFENIIKLYLLGLDIFIFKIQCEFLLNSTIEEENTQNIDMIRIFEKQVSFSRNDSFITSIVSLYKNQYLTRLFDRCKFVLNIASGRDYIEAVLKNENPVERQLLSLFKISSIKKNSKEYSNGELYSNSRLGINDKINFEDLSIQELTSNSNEFFKFYIPNESINIFSKIKINIKSKDDTFDVGFLESDSFILNPDYENLFNRVNDMLSKSIKIESQGLNINSSLEGFITNYNSIKITNVKRRFEDIAYSFGYYDQQSSQNTGATSDLLDFFKSSVFSFELEERFENIGNASFKKKRYFFGNQIIENESIENDSIDIKRSFLRSFLKISTDMIINNSSVKSNDSINSIRVLGKIGKNLKNQNQIPREILDFMSNNNFYLNKKLIIKIIPLPKLIKVYQSQTDLDDNLNIIFPEGVSEDVKNSINLNFVDLFYDKNSSLNWNKFLYFKKLFFEKNKSDSVKSNVVNYMTPIWEYLSSNLYISEKNTFIKRESFSKEDLKNLLFADNDVTEFHENNRYIKSLKSINIICCNSHFEDYNNKYFNFQNNNQNIIKIDNTGMILNFKDLSQNLSSPKTIEIINSNLNKEKRIDLDITQLRQYFNDQDINKMNFLAKISIHPLIRKKDYGIIENINLTDFLITNKDVLQKNYITQNHQYMSLERSSYFFEYNNPLNKLNSNIYETPSGLKISLFLGNNSRKISYNVFKSLFEFSLNNDANILDDFYLRVGFSFEINNNYYYANIYKNIDRNNLNNTDIKIDSVERIREI